MTKKSTDFNISQFKTPHTLQKISNIPVYGSTPASIIYEFKQNQ